MRLNIIWASWLIFLASSTVLHCSNMVMSAPATKQPGLAEIRTADLTFGLDSKSFRTLSNSCVTSFPRLFTFTPGESSLMTSTSSTTEVLKCFCDGSADARWRFNDKRGATKSKNYPTVNNLLRKGPKFTIARIPNQLTFVRQNSCLSDKTNCVDDALQS